MGNKVVYSLHLVCVEAKVSRVRFVFGEWRRRVQNWAQEHPLTALRLVLTMYCLEESTRIMDYCLHGTPKGQWPVSHSYHLRR